MFSAGRRARLLWLPGGAMLVAASWDPELARCIGEALGQDAKARGVNFLLGPRVNIYRLAHDDPHKEGVFVGYRGYRRSSVKPLFPFGYGLPYTTFTLSDLVVTPAGASADEPVTVRFDVHNSGSREGSDVARVDVGDPSATVPRPPKELKGFERVTLRPGQTRQVTVTPDKRPLAYWDDRSRGWQVDPGRFVVYVGDSSENLPLQKDINVR